jgi:hypothetical protein
MVGNGKEINSKKGKFQIPKEENSKFQKGKIPINKFQIPNAI